MHGWTTSSVVNYSPCRPDKFVSPLDFCPSHRQYTESTPELNEEQQQAMSDYNIRVLEQAARMKADQNGQ